VPQPVVFKDPKEVNADRVHLHLEHPLVQRLLNRFLVRGFQGEELSRAAVPLGCTMKCWSWWPNGIQPIRPGGYGC
jgi:hypothetical protein